MRARTLLLADIGNSRVKWGRATGGLIAVGTPFSSESGVLPENLTWHWGKAEAPEAIYVSNVIGAAVRDLLSDWVAKNWNVPVHFASVRVQGYGVVNGYERPEQLGVDRWLALLALRREYDLPACVVDCGTALTLDVLDEDGRHLGGLIAPGLALMRRALVRNTQGIKAVEDGEPGLLGRNTAAGVASGVLRACAGLVEKSMRELAEQLGCPPGLVLTGGNAETIGRSLGISYQLAPDLVLRGLLTIAESKA